MPKEAIQYHQRRSDCPVIAELGIEKKFTRQTSTFEIRANSIGMEFKNEEDSKEGGFSN